MIQFDDASILVADPDVDSLFSIASTLLENRHRVLTARDASIAFNIATNEEIDLMILAMQLGQNTGVKIAQAILESPDRRDLPVMFLSATQRTDVILKRHEFGEFYCLKKPVDATVIKELVDHALWMPHLIRNHLEQSTINEPHVSFGKKPSIPTQPAHGLSGPVFLNNPIAAPLQHAPFHHS